MNYITEIENQIEILKTLQQEQIKLGNAVMVDQLAITISKLCFDASYLKKEAGQPGTEQSTTEIQNLNKNGKAREYVIANDQLNS